MKIAVDAELLRELVYLTQAVELWDKLTPEERKPFKGRAARASTEGLRVLHPGKVKGK